MSDDDLTDEQKAIIRVVKGQIPATAHDVAAGLMWLTRELERIGLELDEAEDRAGDLIEEHGRLYDAAFLKAAFDPDDPARRVTEKVREALARTETWEKRLEMEAAKREVQKLKRMINRLDRRTFVGQSISKVLQAEMRTIGYGGGA